MRARLTEHNAHQISHILDVAVVVVAVVLSAISSLLFVMRTHNICTAVAVAVVVVSTAEQLTAHPEVYKHNQVKEKEKQENRERRYIILHSWTHFRDHRGAIVAVDIIFITKNQKNYE